MPKSGKYIGYLHHAIPTWVSGETVITINVDLEQKMYVIPLIDWCVQNQH